MMTMVNFDNNVCAITDKGLVRSNNEDSNCVERTRNGDLFVVCDGMGGHVGGAIASRIGVDSICHYVNEHDCLMPQQFLTKALEYANTRIFSEACSHPDLKGMGTTACVALVRDDKVWYAHVGDSRIYYLNSKTRTLFRLTKDHSVVQSMVDQGLISESDAEHHPEKNKIRKSLGINATVEPEPCQMPLIPANGDMLLLCSDGLSGMMDEVDILEVLLVANNVNASGKALLELAKSGGGTDNITLQIVKFSDVGEREAVFDAKNKGVSLPVEQNLVKTRKPLWPWITIAASILILLIALMLLFNRPTQDNTVKETPQTTVVEDGYLKEIHGAKPDKTYNHGGREYEYYKLPNGKGLLLYKDTKQYEIGEFKDRVITTDTEQYTIKEANGQTQKYYRDGTPIIQKKTKKQ